MIGSADGPAAPLLVGLALALLVMGLLFAPLNLLDGIVEQLAPRRRLGLPLAALPFLLARAFPPGRLSRQIPCHRVPLNLQLVVARQLRRARPHLAGLHEPR